jgi:hypothetical protein
MLAGFETQSPPQKKKKNTAVLEFGEFQVWASFKAMVSGWWLVELPGFIPRICAQVS